MHIGDWLARREMLTPNKVALIDMLNGARPITYREWNRAANRTANFLREHFGVKKGDRVAVLATNCVEYLDLWFACGKLGAILQTLNWRLTVGELAGLIADATPTVLFYDPDFSEQAKTLDSQFASTPFVILDSNLQSLISNSLNSPPPEVELTRDDPWVICYTGGTTGLPKGALLTHRSITANSVNTVMSWGLAPTDIAILNAPLFHTGGLNVFTAPLVHIGGASIVCRSFDVDQVYDLIGNSGVTLYFGVPTMFIAMQQHPRWAEADFSRLKLIISGGAPCPLPVFEKFWARGVDFKTGYGLTEAGPNTFWLPPEDVRRKPGAVGFPLFHVDVKVIRPDGAECAADEVGELIIRGPHVCAGYWNRPDETAKTIINGWLHTGDLARRDAEGYYTIVGRSKDMIISGGENIYPAEVENVLAAHPAVAEAALIGVPDEKWGEVGRAVVVLQSGQSLTAEALIEFCRERLARYKAPKSAVFVDVLPKTGAAKVDKKALLEKFGK
ncbi:MAG: long-chain fatty acid--CoA ligase [Chloroflexota bacterium]